MLVGLEPLGKFAPRAKIGVAQALLGEVSLAIVEKMSLLHCWKAL
jgi:hypothetical protein